MSAATVSVKKRANRPLVGMAWMLVTGLCFVLVTALVKYVGSDVPPAQSAFLRYILGLGFLVPMIRPILRARLTRGDLALFSLRGVLHSFGVICWFYAMTQIPIAEVTAMNYLNPVYVTVLAVFFLGERMALRRAVAVGLAFVGAVIILRPGDRLYAQLSRRTRNRAGQYTRDRPSDDVRPAPRIRTDGSGGTGQVSRFGMAQTQML